MASTVPESQREAPRAFQCTYAEKENCHETFDSEAEAFSHAIVHHSAPPYHTTEDGQKYKCTLAKELSCNVTFDSKVAIDRHLNSAHPGKRFSCPIAEVHGCTASLTTTSGLQKHILADHKKVRYPCPWAERASCSITFTSSSSAFAHARNTHEATRRSYPCPLAVEEQCSRTFLTSHGAEKHANTAHRQLTYPCPLADEANCAATFKDPDSARRHGKAHSPMRPLYLCPFAEEEKCDKTFLSAAGATGHANSVHRKIRCPCPLAEETNCTATFSTPDAARTHIRTIHNPTRYACPLADEENCNDTFATTNGAIKHADSVHRKIRHPCPLAKENGCTETFARRGDAVIHSKIHLGIRYPCPDAAQSGCKQDFTTERGAKEHAIYHSHPFLCLHSGCSARFASAEDALRHSNSLEHPPMSVFLCPISNCRAAVSGQRFGAGSIRSHREMHTRLGHTSKAEYVPLKVDALPLRSDLTLYTLILQHGTRDPTDQAQPNQRLEDIHDELDHLDSEEADFQDSSKEDDDEMDSKTAFDLPEQLDFCHLGTGVLSKEHRLRILGRNTFKWENGKQLKVMLANLGLTCVGPGPIRDSLVTEPCPEEVTIDLDTARLELRTAQGALILSPRCMACQAVINIKRLLAKNFIEIQPEGTVCAQPGCTLQAVHMSGRCPRHFGSLLTKERRNLTAASLRAAHNVVQSASQTRWAYPPSYDVVRRRTEEILQGSRPGSDLVVLDDEFSPASGQLWEFALVEYVSGRTLISTTVKHRDRIDHHTPGDDPFLRYMSRAKANAVYAPSRRSTIDHMNVGEIASSLQRLGISQDTIFIVYHLNSSDLRMLRKLLVSEGYDNILPHDKNYIPLINILTP